MDPITAGLLLGAGGSILNFFGGRSQAKAQQRRQRMIDQRASGMFQNTATDAERGLQTYINRILGGTASPVANAGNDGLMQLLRSGPGPRVTPESQSLQQILLGGGQPFDLSASFGALQEQDLLDQQAALTTLRGSAGTLGRRFGTAFAGQEAALLRGLAAQRGVRNAGIAQNAYEAAQQRRLGAAQLLLGRESDAANRFLSAAGTAGQMGLQQQSLLNAMFGNLGQLGAQRGAQNTNLLALMAGQAPAPSAWSAAGQSATDIATLLMLYGGLRQPQGGNG